MTHKHGGDVYTYKGILDFSANINFRGMPEPVRAAAEEAVAKSVCYPDPECRALKCALAARENLLTERLLNHPDPIAPRHILCGNGAAELMFALSAAYRPEQALLAVPSFFEYEQALSAFGCSIMRYRLHKENNFVIDESFLEAAENFGQGNPPLDAAQSREHDSRSAKRLQNSVCSDRHGTGSLENDCRLSESLPANASSGADGSGFRESGGPFAENSGNRPRRMMILGSPNNPTGRMIRTEILNRLIDSCAKTRTLLVLDESFFDFLSEKDRRQTFSGVRQIPENPYLFVIRSFTKIYAIPGLRFGYGLCGDSALLERMRELIQPWNVSVVAQAAAQAAACETDFARETAEQIAGCRARLSEALRDCGCRVFPSETNFLLLQAPASLQEQCLRHGILIRDCSNFPGLERPGDGSGYFRVCVRSPEENSRLTQAVRQSMPEPGLGD